MLITQRRCHGRGLVDVRDNQAELIGCAQVARIGRGYTEIETADLGIVGCAGERARRRIEAEPGRQGRAIRETGTVCEDSTHIFVGKRVFGDDNIQRRTFLDSLIGQRGGHRRRIIHVLHREGDAGRRAEIAAVRRGDREPQRAHIPIERRAAEGPGRGSEREPCGETAATRKRGTVGQRIAMDSILIRKRIRRHDEAKRRVLLRGLIRQRIRHRGRIIDILNCERNRVGRAQAAQIRRRHGHVERADIVIERRTTQRTGHRIKAQPGRQCRPAGQRGAVG